MGTKFTHLQCKEVICIADGRRLGFIEDVEIEMPEGRICSIIVPGPCKCLGLWGQRDNYCIPWRCVCKIGPDIVLVDIRPEDCRIPRPRPGIRS